MCDFEYDYAYWNPNEVARRAIWTDDSKNRNSPGIRRKLFPAELFMHRTWITGDGRCLYWKDLDTAHAINIIRMLERRYPPNSIGRNIAHDLYRYIAWREKAHA